MDVVAKPTSRPSARKPELPPPRRVSCYLSWVNTPRKGNKAVIKCLLRALVVLTFFRPDFASAMTITGSLPRDLDAPIELTIAAKISGTVTDTTTYEILNDLSIDFPLLKGQRVLGGHSAEVDPLNLPADGFYFFAMQPTTFTPGTVTFFVKVLSTKGVLAKALAASGTANSLSVSASLQIATSVGVQGDDNSASPDVVAQPTDVLVDPPELLPETLGVTNDGDLEIAWNTPTAFTAKTAGTVALPPKFVHLYAVDMRAADGLNLPCNKYVANDPKNAASQAADTPVTAGCAFTKPPQVGSATKCLAPTDLAGDGSSLDYLVPLSDSPDVVVTTAPFSNRVAVLKGLSSSTQYALFMQYDGADLGTSTCVLATAPDLPLPKGYKPNYSSCFIATAAFGTPLAPELVYFRKFRDHVLLQSSVGEAFVRSYYRWGPRAAHMVKTHTWLKATVRWLLEGPAYLLQAVDRWY